EVIKSSVEDLVPILSESEGIPDTMCDVHLVSNPTPLEAKDHVEIVINSNDDISSSDDDSLYKENIEYVEASPHDSELVSLEVAEIVIPKVEEIEDDNLREKLLNVHLLIAEIEALKDNHTPSSDLLTKSSSTPPKSFLEETNTFHNSLPEFENFYFDLEEISSGSTTTHSDISLSEYDSFIFDLSKDQFPPTDRSDFSHEEFVDELAHIISPPKYDCFYFKNLPDPDQSVLTHLDDLFVDPTPEMFAEEQPLDYSFPPRFDVYPNDFLEIKSDANFDADSFDSEGEKIKEAELLIDQLDLPCDILFEYDSFTSQYFSSDDVLFSPNNEDKDFDPPFSELLVFKEVPNSMRLLPFSSENEEKVFKPGIYTFKKFHCYFLSELSHP
nr:hypothetical protein [Tanacetum cinerariifolium]